MPPTSPPRPSPLASTWGLWVALLFPTLVLGALAAAGRLPASHDGLQYMQIQYWFANAARLEGPGSFWLPYMTQGTVSNWWQTIQMAPVQATACLFPSLLPEGGILPLFYAGIWFQEVMLGVGTWLLARRLFPDPRVAPFLAITACGSALGVTQAWHNLNQVAALPWILWLGHRFLDTGRWRYALLAGNLLAMQALGNMPYGLPATTAMIFLYFLPYAGLHRAHVLGNLRQAAGRPLRGAAATALTLGTLGIAYTLMTAGTSEIVRNAPGRSQGGAVSLQEFLTYAGNTDLGKWRELLTGMSLHHDYSIFLGVFAIPLLVAGLGRWTRRDGALWATFLLALAFSCATPVSVALYYLFPGMKYFRHLALLSPVVRTFLVLLLGIGLERVLAEGEGGDAARRRFSLAATSLAVVCILLALVPGVSYLLTLWDPEAHVGLIFDRFLIFRNGFVHLARRLGVLAAAGAVVAALLARRGPGQARLLLVVAALDLASYKLVSTWIRTIRVRAEDQALLRWQPLPFKMRRTEHPRYRDRHRMMVQSFPHQFDKRMGISYWSYETFSFDDLVYSPYRTDHWLRSLDDLLAVCNGQVPSARAHGRSLLEPDWHLVVPLHRPFAPSVLGITQDKLAVFERPCRVKTAAAAGEHMLAPGFTGETLVLLDLAASEEDCGPESVETSTRVEGAAIEVLDFRPGSLDLRVDVPAGDGGETWLLYKDAWHPGWSATVDQRPTPILRGQLGYKALQIPRGRHQVRLEFEIPWTQECWLVMAVLSALWVGGVLVLIVGYLAGAEVPGPREFAVSAGAEPEVPDSLAAAPPGQGEAEPDAAVPPTP